jgi:hypothetical protein
MPRTCTTCTHPQRDEIDRLLLDGTPLRNIAKQYSLSPARTHLINRIRVPLLSLLPDSFRYLVIQNDTA